MRTALFRCLGLIAAVVLTAVTAAVTESTQASATLTPSIAQATGRSDPSPPVAWPPACLGAVTYTLDAADGGPPWPALCLSLGAVLRVENHGPDGSAVRPSVRVACRYAAGVHECRFVRTGTVTFTVTGALQVRRLTVVVVETPSAPPTSPRCLGAVVYTVDASQSGPSELALCLSLGAVLRVENHGPDGFAVKPSAKASCWYAAGVRECRLVRRGTVTFTITRAEQTRRITVVVR